MATECMMWDWKEQPDIDELYRIVSNMTAVRPRDMIRVISVRTGTDEYGIVITDDGLDQAQADAHWDAWRSSDH